MDIDCNKMINNNKIMADNGASYYKDEYVEEVEAEIKRLRKALTVYSEGAENEYAVAYTKMVSGNKVSIMKSFIDYSELAKQTLKE